MFDWDEDNTTYLDSEAAPGYSNATPAAAVDDVASYANATAVANNVDPMSILRYICEVWITMPIAIAGIIGNLVSIFVLRQYKPAMTTTIILQCLAWTDTAYLTASVILRSLRYIGIPNYETYYPYIFFWLHPTMYVIRLTGAWLTVLLTVDRFIAVCYPLHASRLCSRAKTSILILIIALCSFAFSVPRYFEYIAINPSNQTLRRSAAPESSELMKNRSYTFIYRLSLFFIAMYLVPMTTVTILNTRLLVTFRRTAKNRATSLCVNSFTSTSSHSSSSDRSVSITKASCSSSCSSSASSSFCSMTRTVTAVSLTVVLISIATDTVAMMSHSLWSIELVFPHLRTVSYYRKYLSNFSNVAVTLRCALNFVVYCAVSRQFRVVLYRSLVCSSRAPTSTRGIGHHHHRRHAAPAAGRQSSKASDKISTSILSLLLTGQRQKTSPSPSPVLSPNGVVDENGCRVEVSPFNHALVTFVKR